MLITTANYLPDNKILKTYDPITVNLVLGTNIFSDFNASLTDFFGGRSGSYEKRLNALFHDAKTNLVAQVKRLGGNGIIGFTVSYNELNGKDKSMLMISIYGTPILINETANNSNVDNESIGYEIFDNMLKAFRILEYYKDEVKVINSKDLKFVLSSGNRNLENFVHKLINTDGLQLREDGVDGYLNKEKFLEFYRGFGDDNKCEILYKELEKSLDKKHIANLYFQFIKTDKVINLELILENVKIREITQSLWYYELALEAKENYSKTDIDKLEGVRDNFMNIKSEFELNKVTEKGMFGSSEKWICPKCQEKNNLDKKICSNCKYQIIKFPTFKGTPEFYISELQLRIDVLKSIFSS